MSFSILKTNVGLTTNTKIMIDSKYKMYLESIDSVVELSNQSYKKFEFNKDSYYDETLSLFIGKVPSELAYSIRYEDDNDNMYTSFVNQTDELYQCGARNIYNNKGYSEEYEYFAPLYLDGNLPSNFIIFRVDGPGNIKLTNKNFRKEIVKNLKVVKTYDLTKKSILGEWLYKNYIENEYFINDSLLIDFRENYFSTVGGIDLVGGGYVRKSINTNELFTSENTFTDTNTHFHGLYSKNSIVYPNIVNLNFLYDDTPSTPTTTREWSLNRYFGFYVDSLDIIKRYTFHTPIALVDTVKVGLDNVLSYTGYKSPFIDINSTKVHYVEIEGVYSRIVPFEQVIGYGLVNVEGETITQKKDVTNVVRWKIVSTKDYNGYEYDDMNKHIISISHDGVISGAELPSSVLIESTDLWLFRLGDEYVVVDIVDNSGAYTIKINSDYSFEMSGDILRISSAGEVINTIPGISQNGTPISFELCRCNFTDVKDFDTNVINSGFANFEYDIDNTLVKTDESKLYYGDYSSNANPIEYDEFTINGKIENIPVSSEFIANGELFEIVNNDLTPLWRKNPSWCKWGYTNSINTFDYPYLLNNSLLGEDFNRGVNVYLETPDRSERNLDYFYTIMDDSISKNFKFQSLHVSGNFDLSKYLGLGYYKNDYFSYYFGKSVELSDGMVVVDKWSKFNDGNGVSPNNSLFRGLKFNIYDVKSIKLTNNDISELNIESSSSFDDYKLSILATESDTEYDGDTFTLSTISNPRKWIKISQYEFGVNYTQGDVVMHYGILWNCASATVYEINPIINPANSTMGIVRNWGIGSGVATVNDNNFKGMWQPNTAYGVLDVVLYNGEYMVLKTAITSGGIDIWNPLIGYPPNTMVYKGGVYYTSSKAVPGPSMTIGIKEPGSDSEYWDAVTVRPSVLNWVIISIWEPNSSYVIGSFVYWNGTLYLSQSDNAIEPGYDELVWKEIHTLEVKSNEVYRFGAIVSIDDDFYVSNSPISSISSGITIYINKKWKNILININSNDGLVTNITNVPRDSMYSYENGKMVAYNFIEYVNGLNKKGGFSKSLTYVVINEDGMTEYYDSSNITDTPYYINIEKPDVLYTVIGSLIYKNVNINMNKFKINFQLDKSDMSSLERKNWYNGGIGIANKISRNLSNIQLVSGYHGLSNVVYNKLFRHSGEYSPIFTKVELFVRGVDNIGNYKFGTELINFGMVRDVIISKVNRKKNILKLNNVLDTRSIYPMIDEFGYTVMDKFIFKSSWDDSFYYEVNSNDRSFDKNNKNNKIIN